MHLQTYIRRYTYTCQNTNVLVRLRARLHIDIFANMHANVCAFAPTRLLGTYRSGHILRTCACSCCQATAKTHPACTCSQRQANVQSNPRAQFLPRVSPAQLVLSLPSCRAPGFPAEPEFGHDNLGNCARV